MDVILDWLTEHSDGFLPPGPALQDQLIALEERGAPNTLIALYQRVGQGAVGLLPCGSFDGLYPLLDPTDVLAMLERPAIHPALADGWPFAGDNGGWLVLQDEAIFHVASQGAPRRVAESTEEMLFRHMEDLLEGRYRWNPGRECFVPTRMMPTACIRSAVMALAYPDLLERWTEEIVTELAAGLPVEISGVGKLVVTRHSPSRCIDVTSGRVFRRPSRVTARLRHDRHGALSRRINGEQDPRAIRPQQLRSEGPCPVTLATAVVSALASALLEGRILSWPGLGEFSLSTQPAYTTHDRHGLSQSVPPRKAVTFSPYPAVLRALR